MNESPVLPQKKDLLGTGDTKLLLQEYGFLHPSELSKITGQPFYSQQTLTAALYKNVEC